MSQLLLETKQLLKSEVGKFPEIVKESAGEIKYDWLCQLNQDRITSPGIKKLETLNKILKSRRKKAAK